MIERADVLGTQVSFRDVPVGKPRTSRPSARVEFLAFDFIGDDDGAGTHYSQSGYGEQHTEGT